MKQSLRKTVVRDIKQKLAKLAEDLVGGFTVGDRVFAGLTTKARRSMLVMLEQVVFFTIAGTSPEKKVNAYDLLRRFSKKVLSGSLWRSQYSPKVCAEMASDQFDDVSFSETHMHKIREYCAALGVFVIEGREFARGADGKFLPGQNKGKKYASWLYEIDFERLALVACALIQSLKGEVVHSEEGTDAWDVLKPKKGCALVALLWRQLKLKGSIFAPDLEDGGTTSEEATYDQYMSAKSAKQKIEALIYEKLHLARQHKKEGRKMSPAFWEMFRRDRDYLRKLKAKIASGHRQLVQDFGLAIEEIKPVVDQSEYSDLLY